MAHLHTNSHKAFLILLQSLLFLYAAAVYTLCWAHTALYFTQKTAAFTPNYPQANIGMLLKKQSLSEEDFRTLFLQCGLSRAGIQRLPSPADAAAYQRQFFAKSSFFCSAFGGIGYTEFLQNSSRLIVPLKNGDILVTPCAHILSFRIGHAAIVADAERGITVEALSLGSPSDYSSVHKWTGYPSFAVLHCKEENTAQNAAQYACENLVGLKYRLLPKRYAHNESPLKTQCSHLVWQAYAAAGTDIAPKSGLVITPRDLIRSPVLEVVQICGINPETMWSWTG